MTVKHLALLAAFFWVGAVSAGLIIELLDVYWTGHPSPHSKSALFHIQTIGMLVVATVGTILYLICLMVQRLKRISMSVSIILLSIASGVVYSAVLGLSGQGVLILNGGTTNIGWTLLFFLPMVLSLLIRLHRLQTETSSTSLAP